MGRLKTFVSGQVPLMVFSSVLLFARASLADHYVVPSGSMEPNVLVGDHVFVNKSAYALRVPLTHVAIARYRQPSRGDVVVLDAPDEDTVLLKRVVAIGGDHVTVTDGHVSVNGQPTAHGPTDTFSTGEVQLSLGDGPGPDFGPMTIPAGEVLLLGDHRGNSRDGRYFGLVHEDRILGRALGIYWRSGPTWAPLRPTRRP